MEKIIENKKVILIGVLLIFIFGVISVIVLINKNKNDEFQNVGIESFLADTAGSGETVDNGLDNEGNSKESSLQNNGNTSEEEIFIHIIGEVNNPGVVKIKQGQRIVDAIEKAGGATDKADLSKINLAFVLSDGQKVIIPGVNDKELDSYVVDGGGGAVADKSGVLGSGSSVVRQKVNINTATQSELETLNGIGPSLADKIIKYREKNGKFKKIEDLMNVSGIGESKFEGVKDEVCVK